MHGICVVCKKELYDKHKDKNLCHKCNAHYNRVILNIKKITFTPSFWARFKTYHEKIKNKSNIDLKCQKCDKVFTCVYTLNRHFRTKHETSTSASGSTLERPRRKVHLDEKTCESAVTPSISFSTSNFCDSKGLDENFPEIYPCKGCSELFYSQSQLQAHSSQTCSTKNQCPKCDRLFTPRKLENHLISRHSLEPKVVQPLILKNQKEPLDESEIMNLMAGAPKQKYFGDAEIAPVKDTGDYREYKLPHGWKKVGHRRINAKNSKSWDFYVISPCGKKFRSTIELKKYLLDNPHIKCDRYVTNTNRPRDLSSYVEKTFLKSPSKISPIYKDSDSVDQTFKCHLCNFELPSLKRLQLHMARIHSHVKTQVLFKSGEDLNVSKFQLKAHAKVCTLKECSKCDQWKKLISPPVIKLNKLAIPPGQMSFTNIENIVPNLQKSSTELCDSTNKHLNVDTEASLNSTQTAATTKEKKEYSLPYGWKKMGNKRKNGDNWDFYVICPSGKRFRSNVEINRYLDANPDIKCDRNVTNTNRSAEGEPMRKSMKLFDSKAIDSSEAEETSDAGNDYIFKCQKCPKVLNSALDLKSHFEKMHGDTNRRFSNRKFDEKLGNFEDLPEASLYRCLNCPYRTNVPEEMISHHIDNH